MAAAAARTVVHAAPPSPLISEVSTTLTVSAAAAYEVFADATEIPRWLPIVQTARTLARYPDARPRRVAFTRMLERGSLGYTLEYSYDPAALTVAWTTPEASNVVLTGEARFVPLSSRACLMLYKLVLDLPIVDDLINNELDKHPASQVVAEFREHLRRLC
ncbi:MAG: SRPBCC family protein [Myxococcales bacterium]|nr:SRPBCC family protein [Myxococcales bacterium]